MSDESDPQVDSSKTNLKRVRLRANKPSSRLLWAVLLFFLSFLVTAMGLTLIAPDGTLTIWALAFSFVLSLLVWLVPFSNYCLELEILSTGLQITKKNGNKISLSFEKIRLIAVASRLNLNDTSVERWGCLYLLAEKRRYGFFFPSGTTIGVYRTLTARIPSALGIGGDGKIDLPAIGDLLAMQDYITEQRTTLAKELTREVLRNMATSCFALLILGVAGYVLAKSDALPIFLHAYSRYIFGVFLLAITVGLWNHAFQSVRRRGKILAAIDRAIQGMAIDENIIRQPLDPSE